MKQHGMHVTGCVEVVLSVTLSLFLRSVRPSSSHQISLRGRSWVKKMQDLIGVSSDRSECGSLKVTPAWAALSFSNAMIKGHDEASSTPSGRTCQPPLATFLMTSLQEKKKKKAAFLTTDGAELRGMIFSSCSFCTLSFIIIVRREE